MLNVKKTSLLSIAFILLFSLYFSCNATQKKSAQADILKIAYYVRYLHSDKQVKAEISFSEIVDSTKKIIPKKMEEVLFQNNVLDGKKIADQYKYQGAMQIPFADHFDFSYRDNTQQVAAIQAVSINPVTDFTIKKNKVSKLGGTTLTLAGNPLLAEEAIVVLLSDVNNKTVTLFAKELAIKINPEKVKDLSLGQGTIYTVRKQNIAETNTNYQLTGLTEYYSEVKEIEIVE